MVSLESRADQAVDTSRSELRRPLGRVSFSLNDGDPKQFPPTDLLDLSWARNLSQLVGVDVTYSLTTCSDVFGDSSLTIRVRDGIACEVVEGVADDAEVHFGVELRNHLLSRCGLITVAEAIGDTGTIDGEFDSLLLIAGLLETPTWVHSRRLDLGTIAVHDAIVELWNAGALENLLCGTI
jgi:hypothetical protein